MRYWPLLFFAFTSTQAAADDLSDFSNNLATDVGPLIVLFGESMTRQYLSESTSFLDYFIFAMAPIGIITAMVSVIRVCGHSTLRAFIGRSQEGDGVVEAELCTSTSRDVCELFNKGGITRVLGRPQILELIHVKNPNREDELHLFRHYLKVGNSPWSEWRIPGVEHSSDGSTSTNTKFSPKPNLSLNVGIVQRPREVFVFIAILGCVLQGGVLVLAGVGVWILGWNLSDSGSSASTNYAPIMFITGTIVMCGGMFWCAALIGQTTQEVRYERRPGTPQSRLVWLQPGPQVIGDQSFDAFAHLEDTEKEPLRAWTSSRKDFDERFELYTFFAVAAVLLGYISQFIGLRGMKAWVSLAQLGITVIMSILRGLLRVQRLGRDANKVAKLPDMIAGYELDWLTFELTLGSEIGNTSFSITGQYDNISSTGSDSIPKSEITNHHENKIDFGKVLHIRKRLSHLTGHNFQEPDNKYTQQWDNSQVKAREPAQKLATAICKVAEKLIRKKGIKDNTITIQIQIAARTDVDHIHEVQMFDIDLTPLNGSQTKWSVDSSLLEAILGLSMWSLMSDKPLHETDQTGNTVSLFENLKWERIIYCVPENRPRNSAGISTSARPESSIDIRMWFGPDEKTIIHKFVTIAKQYVDGLVTGWRNIQDDLFWYRRCGWNTVHASLQSLLDHSPSNDGYNVIISLPVALVPTEDSFPHICAQNLFLAIASPLVNLLDIGETHIRESGGHVLLQNSTVTAISDILVENGIATPFDALSCAVSLLATRIHPDQDTILSLVTKTANEYRRNGEWERAETLMQWACLKFLRPGYSISENERIDDNASLTSNVLLGRFLQVLQTTGELYRWSCSQSPDTQRVEFGLEGIKWMMTKFNNLYLSVVNLKVKEVLENYEHISNLVGNSSSSDWKPPNVPTANDRTKKHPLVEAIFGRDRKTTLWHLCFTATGDFDRHQLRSALPLSARNGWTEVVDAILELKGDLDSRDEEGRTSISYCAEHGHLSLLQQFINSGASVNSKDNRDRTPLHVAVQCKQEMAAKILLRVRSINHNQYDFDRMNPLDWAIRNGLVEIMHLLLDLEDRLEPRARVTHGSLILDAAKTGNRAVLDALAQRNININSTDDFSASTPLKEAVSEGHKTAVELLLMYKAMVYEPDNNSNPSWPIVLLALEMRDEEITNLLLEHTDTTTLAAYPGIWTSLLIATAGGYWSCAKLVLQKCVCSLAINNRDTNAPILSTASPHEAVHHLLLRLQDTASDDCNSGNSIETFDLDESVAKMLIRKGANPEAQERDGRTALTTAAKCQRIRMIRAMLENGADAETTDGDSENALYYACQAGNEDITSLLLEKNAKVYARRIPYVYRTHQAIRCLLSDAAASEEDRESLLREWEMLDSRTEARNVDEDAV